MNLRVSAWLDKRENGNYVYAPSILMGKGGLYMYVPSILVEIDGLDTCAATILLPTHVYNVKL